MKKVFITLLAIAFSSAAYCCICSSKVVPPKPKFIATANAIYLYDFESKHNGIDNLGASLSMGILSPYQWSAFYVETSWVNRSGNYKDNMRLGASYEFNFMGGKKCYPVALKCNVGLGYRFNNSVYGTAGLRFEGQNKKFTPFIGAKIMGESPISNKNIGYSIIAELGFRLKL